MRVEYEEEFFDTLRSRVRERLGIDPPSTIPWIKFNSYFRGHDCYECEFFNFVCYFVAEYLLSPVDFGQCSTAVFDDLKECDRFSISNLRLGSESALVHRLTEQLSEFDERDIVGSDSEHELFSIVLDQVQHGEPTVQAAALEIVCPRVINQKVWFYPLLKVRAKQIVPAISIALRSDNIMVLERAIFAWTTFCAGNPENFELLDYLRVLEIWEDTRLVEVNDVAGDAVALVPESIFETLSWNKKMEPLSDKQIDLLWNRTVETLIKVLSKYPPTEICRSFDFLCLLDSAIRRVQNKCILVELVKSLAKHSNDVLGHGLENEQYFMRKFLASVNSVTFDFSERMELFSFQCFGKATSKACNQ